MWEDPIVAEVHRTREKLAAEYNFDITAFFADLRKRQAALTRGDDHEPHSSRRRGHPEARRQAGTGPEAEPGAGPGSGYRASAARVAGRRPVLGQDEVDRGGAKGPRARPPKPG